MQKLKVAGVWAAVLLLAVALGLAGCDTATPEPPVEPPVNPPVEPPVEPPALVGAAIVEFEPDFITITSSGFSIRRSSQAVVSENNPGEQEPEYGVTFSMASPPTTWQTELTFTGLLAGEECYVWARAKAKGNYPAGAAYLAVDTVTIGSEEVEGMSVDPAWEPNPVYTANGEFTINPAVPMVTGRRIQYAINDDLTVEPTTWRPNPVFNLDDDITDPAEQYYFWARTRAASDGSYPAGKALPKEVWLPGASLAVASGWLATQNNTISGQTIALTITGSPAKDPNSSAFVIQYRLAPDTSTNGEGEGSSPWRVLNQDRTVTFSDLPASTRFSLWARTRGTTGTTTADQHVPNFLPGPALMYPEWTFATSGAPMSGTELADQLNAMVPGGGVAGGGAGWVRVNQDFSLSRDIVIPLGIKLIVSSGVKFNAGTNQITGQGTIEVAAGGDMRSNISVFVPVTVYESGKYWGEVRASIGPKKENGSTDVIELNEGIITVAASRTTIEYTLDGVAELKETFTLGANDIFTIVNGGVLDASKTHQSGGVDIPWFALDGTIDVRYGGRLVLPQDYDFLKGIINAGNIQIEAGGEVAFAPYNSKEPDLFIRRTDDKKGLILQDGTIGITNEFKTAASAERIPVFTISGRTRLVGENKIPAANAVYEVKIPMTIAAGGKLIVGTDGKKPATLNLSNTLTLEEGTDSSLVGGTLEIGDGGQVTGASTVTGGAKSVVKLDKDGKIDVRITTNGKFDIPSTATAAVISRAVTLDDGAEMEIRGKVALNVNITVGPGTSLRVRNDDPPDPPEDPPQKTAAITGTGDINVTGGTLTVTSIFDGFSGYGKTITISDGGMLIKDGDASSPYIGFDDATGENHPAKGFRLLKTTTTPNPNLFTITFPTTGPTPLFKLTGTAYVEGYPGMETALNIGILDITNGTLRFEKDQNKLTLSGGTELRGVTVSNTTSNLVGPTTGKGYIHNIGGTGTPAKIVGSGTTAPPNITFEAFTDIPTGW